MSLVTVGPFLDKRDAEKRLEDAKREYKWCYDDGGIEEGVGCWSIWYRVVYRPRPEELPMHPQKTLSTTQLTLF